MPIPIYSRISFEPHVTTGERKQTGWIHNDLVKLNYKRKSTMKLEKICQSQADNSLHLLLFQSCHSLSLWIQAICFFSFLNCFCFWILFYSYSSLFFYFLTIFYDFSNLSFFIKSNNYKITFLKGRKHRSKKRRMLEHQQNKRQDWKQKQRKRQKQRKKLE